MLNETFVVKVADFGLSAKVDASAIDATIPIRWTSPEVLQGNHFTKANDVWAFGTTSFNLKSDSGGVTMWEICERKRPYYDVASNNLISQGVVNGTLRLTRPQGTHVTDVIWEMTNSCFLPAEDRPTFQEIIKKLALVQPDDGDRTTTSGDFSTPQDEDVYRFTPKNVKHVDPHVAAPRLTE